MRSSNPKALTIAGLGGASVGQQRQHQHDRDAISLQSVEQRPLGYTKGRIAFRTGITLLYLAVDRDIAFGLLPSCRTLDIRAEYCLRIHGLISLVWLPGVFVHESAFRKSINGKNGCFPLLTYQSRYRAVLPD